ncbi:MAG: ribose 5-phosphate isomerase A [Anaerolineales bacterium]|jgi:ribose 5-phosphate isomerase A
MNLKQKAASYALNFIHDGMVLGLGSGSTTSYFVDMLGERVKTGALRDIRGVPTSRETAEQARKLGIPLTTLTDLAGETGTPRLHLTVDGADEVDPDLNLIKGLGQALLREKIIEIHTDRFVVIVDESKIVERLGSHVPLPVEVVTFEAKVHVNWLNAQGCRAELWLEEDGSPVVTDNQNYLARCWFEGGIPDAYKLAQTLAERPGILEHGLFLNMASEVIVADPEGVRVLEREK